MLLYKAVFKIWQTVIFTTVRKSRFYNRNNGFFSYLKKNQKKGPCLWKALKGVTYLFQPHIGFIGQQIQFGFAVSFLAPLARWIRTVARFRTSSPF